MQPAGRTLVPVEGATALRSQRAGKGQAPGTVPALPPAAQGEESRTWSSRRRREGNHSKVFSRASVTVPDATRRLRGAVGRRYSGFAVASVEGPWSVCWRGSGSGASAGLNRGRDYDFEHERDSESVSAGDRAASKIVQTYCALSQRFGRFRLPTKRGRGSGAAPGWPSFSLLLEYGVNRGNGTCCAGLRMVRGSWNWDRSA